jgi:hypothetical protein
VTLHPHQIVGLRRVAVGEAAFVQRAQLKFFARNGLAEFRETDERGRKVWRLTEAGSEALAMAKDVTTPNVPRSLMPASGYYVTGRAAPVAGFSPGPVKGIRGLVRKGTLSK